MQRSQPTVMTKKWFALYTKPRWEKKVNLLLTAKGIETYCPLNKVKRQWSDRVKTIDEPLFKSYVFVKIDDTERTKVRLTHGVINFVYWNQKPAIVKEREIETIKRFLNDHENVGLRPLELAVNQLVTFTSGTFMDLKARVLDVRKKEVKVVIESLGCELIAVVDKNKLALLDDVL